MLAVVITTRVGPAHGSDGLCVGKPAATPAHRNGSNAGGPSVGAIVVWRHHVGKIVGQENDAGARQLAAIL
jgi:hypothetical protein